MWANLEMEGHVPEPSLPDHKIILFDLKGSTLQQVPKRNPRGTDWESYGRHASSNLGNVARQGMISGMELLEPPRERSEHMYSGSVPQQL